MSARSGARARPERRYRRLTLRVDVGIETPAGSFDAVATTLGAGGLFVATGSPLAAGLRVAVELRLPDGEPPEPLAARVAWREPSADGSGTPGMGLEFTDAGERTQLAARLEAWIAERDPNA